MKIHRQRCDSWAVISIDRRGVIRQEPAANEAEARARALVLAEARVNVVVEDPWGRVRMECTFD